MLNDGDLHLKRVAKINFKSWTRERQLKMHFYIKFWILVCEKMGDKPNKIFCLQSVTVIYFFYFADGTTKENFITYLSSPIRINNFDDSYYCQHLAAKYQLGGQPRLCSSV